MDNDGAGRLLEAIGNNRPRGMNKLKGQTLRQNPAYNLMLRVKALEPCVNDAPAF